MTWYLGGCEGGEHPNAASEITTRSIPRDRSVFILDARGDHVI